ncbi:MAG: PD-(D/E)XK nuclease family protein [Fimbriimonadaceae bacterium]
METEAILELTKFCVNNPELEQLESILGEFNIFEATGLTRQEIRHSKFLAFLLDPKESHGLGELFVTKLLQISVLEKSPDEVGVSALDIELMDLSDLQVACEVKNIDILLLSSKSRFAVVIENKVGSQEHSNQLPRYLRIVEDMKADWRVLPIFLSPAGDIPSDSRYFPVSYEQICAILVELLENRKSSIGPDIAIAISHYERLLRRHVVSDSKLNELCQQILTKHRRAIEVLIEHMEDPRVQAWEVTDECLEKHGFIRVERRWMPADWLNWVPKSNEAGSGYILNFFVDVYGKRLRLILEIQPGPVEIRSAIFEAVSKSKHLGSRRKVMTSQWTKILDFELSDTREPTGDKELWIRHINEQMSLFCKEILPEVELALKEAVQGFNSNIQNE